MPLIQALKRRQLAHLQQPDAVIRQRHLQPQLLLHPLRPGEDADDLGVDLEAVEQVGEVGEVGRGGFFAVDVQPDEAAWGDGAAEDFHHVEGVDVGEAGADEGHGVVVVSSAEGGAGFVGGGGVDWGGFDGGLGAHGGWEVGHCEGLRGGCL